MKFKKKYLIALTLIIIILTSYIYYGSNHVWEMEGTPKSQVLELRLEDRTLEVTIESYLEEELDSLTYIKLTLTAPDVRKIYLIFNTRGVDGKGIQQITKASGVIGYAIGLNEMNVLPREEDTIRRALIFSGFMGGKSMPIIYLKTPNVGGEKNRIILKDHIIILESESYEAISDLAQFIFNLLSG
ncbi:MAG: hypothetical protein ACE5K0_10365 [Candidatus Methanofastidiosia archaeon]